MTHGVRTIRPVASSRSFRRSQRLREFPGVCCSHWTMQHRGGIMDFDAVEWDEGNLDHVTGHGSRSPAPEACCDASTLAAPPRPREVEPSLRPVRTRRPSGTHRVHTAAVNRQNRSTPLNDEVQCVPQESTTSMSHRQSMKRPLKAVARVRIPSGLHPESFHLRILIPSLTGQLPQVSLPTES